MTTVALIPVKDLDQAKTRLAPVLDDPARRELVLAMLHDVLDAALGCAAIDRAAVVTRDPLVLALAASLGAEGMREPGGLNEALDAAARRVAEAGATRIVVIAADLPFARADGIASVVANGADVALVPSKDGGTNALASAPGAFAFAFGPDSATRHEAAAQAAGLQAERLALPDLVLDIDTPEDLDRLRDEIDRAGAHTRAALQRLGLVSAAR
ncbi:MAG: 2-phospho-L-lactate guanylyltransferase [Dehalococcoidia bacterium]